MMRQMSPDLVRIGDENEEGAKLFASSPALDQRYLTSEEPDDADFEAAIIRERA